MDGLKMPLPLARARVQAQDGLREQVGSGAPSAPVVAARRARRHVEQPALFVQRHQAPHVRMTGDAPRLVLPGVGPERVVRLRDGEEDPAALARARIECLHRPGRVVLALDTVRDSTADDHQVVVDHRGRGLVVLFGRHFSPVPLGEQDAAVVPEARDQLAGGGIDRVEAGAAVEKQVQLVPVAPERQAPLVKTSRARAAGRVFVDPRIVDPLLVPGVGVERHHARERRGKVERVVDHQRRRLKAAGTGVRQRRLARIPRPGDLQLADVREIDVVQRRMLGMGLVAADVGPFDGRPARLLAARRRGQADDENRAGSFHVKLQCQPGAARL